MKTINRQKLLFQSMVFMVCSLISINVKGQTPDSDKNYILGVELLEPVTAVPTDLNTLPDGHKKVSIMYFDDLGRENQSIMHKATPEGKDIVTIFEYDGFGRQSKDYLPAPTQQSNGLFITDPTAAYTAHYGAAPYNTDIYYSEKKIESSPLNRILKQAAPGDDWQLDSGHEIKFGYYSNNAKEVDLYWTDNGVLKKGGYPAIGDTYPARALRRIITTDENGNSVYEYKDKKGRLVLSRTFVEKDQTPGRSNPDPKTTEKADTYYVYDIYGNLSFVIPPKAAAITSTGTVPAAVIEELCYRYTYDNRRRITERQLPGKEVEYMVYDKQNRLVATQDGEMRKTSFKFPSGMTGKAWAFTKYDKFGRILYTGLYRSDDERIDIQSEVDNMGNNSEITSGQFTQNGITAYYSSHLAFPAGHTASDSDLLTVSYYDEYKTDLLTADGISIPTVIEGQNIREGGNGETESLKGLPTISHIRVLPDEGWERAYTFYDEKSRPVYTHKINHLGGYTIVKTKLNFRGAPEYTISLHKRNSAAPELEIKDIFVYDNMERMTRHTQSLNNSSTENLIALNEYDKLGQLKIKKIGGTQNGADRWQEVDYSYNIRGWLTDINDTEQLQKTGKPADLFAFKINYNNTVAGDFQTAGLDVQPLFNGNIAETYWRTASDNTLRGYGYAYDELNRLKSAYYRKPNTITPLPQTFDEYLAYDLNGNITGLQRYSGNDTPGSAQLTDELDYSYFTNSNRLREVTDNQNSSIGFDDGNTTGDDYEYDLNGNMTKDKNKGITSILYNHLNLPVEIIWSSTKKIEYLYNAAGVKVRKKVTNGTNIKTTDYLDGFQYNDNFLEFFPHAEGYVKATPTSLNQNNPEYSFNYVFNYTDHLGNVRVSYTKDPQTGNLKILDESHYYPFGLKHQEYSTFGFVNNPIQGVVIAPLINNPYKYEYNGKEWQDELSLNMYDMDMRQYDPAIARWVVMDPVIHHSMSPYSAFDNNPVFWADPSGADSEFFSAFPDQNIDHYGTSNTIDIANIMEANQKMENTMLMIEALIKLAEDYGGKNSQTGVQPDNGDNGMQENPTPWDLNGDGILQKIEADYWYIKGEGKSITVDGNKIDLKGIDASDLIYNKETNTYSLNTTKAFIQLPYETAATYGGSTFKLVDGKWQMQSQEYHYRMRDWNSFENIGRNILTIVGDPNQTIRPSQMNTVNRQIPSKGTSYFINIKY